MLLVQLINNLSFIPVFLLDGWINLLTESNNATDELIWAGLNSANNKNSKRAYKNIWNVVLEYLRILPML